MNRRRPLAARDRVHLWHPYTQMQTAPDPVAVVSGHGVYLHTEDGRRIKAYTLTTAGRKHLTAEKRQWERIVAAVGQVLETS